MKVIPVNFHIRHKEMLGQSKMLSERGNIAINPKFDKLITALRTAVDNGGTLDKATSYNDFMPLGWTCHVMVIVATNYLRQPNN